MDSTFSMRIGLLVGILFVTLVSGTRGAALSADDFSARYRNLAAEKEKLSDTERLNKLFDLQWQYRMTESPETATELGFAGQNDRWSDLSWGAISRRRE